MYKEDGDDDWVCFATLSSHDSTVWSMSFDKTGKRLASCGDDKCVKVWQEYASDNEEGVKNSVQFGMKKDPVWKCVTTLSGFHTRCIYDIDWSRINNLIATACGDDSIRIFGETSSDGKADELNKVMIFNHVIGGDSLTRICKCNLVIISNLFSERACIRNKVSKRKCT